MQPQNLNEPPHRVATTSAPQPSNLLRGFQGSPLNWFAFKLRNLSIASKIRRGYALVVGVAIGGTTVGLIAGNYYYQKSGKQVNLDEENHQLRDLQTALLRTQTDQHRLLYLLQQPEHFQSKYDQLQKHTDSLKKLLSELKMEAEEAQVKGFQAFLKRYEQTLATYIQKQEEMIGQIAVLRNSNAGVRGSEKLLSDFANNKIGLELDSLADELEVVVDAADKQENEGRAELVRAEVVRSQIIIASMALSAIIAALVATYTSRAIANPIKTVTHIAQQVTEESNFDLQVSVSSGDEVGILGTSLNQLILKVKQLLEELEAERDSQLLQSEKMASLGRMLAGVAHEINNPVNFIYGNLEPTKDYIENLLSLIDTYETEIPNPPLAVQNKVEEIDLPFVKEDLLKILESMKVGAERARAIIISLKDFSRLDQAKPHPVDLHACLESTLLILNNRIKKGIHVVRNYNEIPKVEGYMGLLYQVFMNILSNAIDALEEAKEKEKSREIDFSPTIKITTERLDNDSVSVRFSDNGTGMPPRTKEKMFQTFFTTKPRGVGTGLGLAISRNIVVEKHGGTINYWSEEGSGTEFIIALPIQQEFNG